MSFSTLRTKSEAVAATVGSGDIGFQHPVVRRLLKEVDRVFDQVLSPHEGERLKQITTSLALPVSLLIDIDKNWQDKRKRRKLLESFKEGIEFLSKMDLPSDEHIDLIKYDAALLFQKAVSDIDPLTGHDALPFPASLEKYERRRVFGGELNQLIQRALARAKDNHRQSLSFFASYLLCKRGWPELGHSKMKDTLIDYVKYLTVMPDAPRDSLLSEIRTICKKIFRNTTLSKLSPSLNASSESGRKQGGADGFVARELTHVSLSDLLPSKFGARQFHEAKINWQEYTFDKCDEYMQATDCSEFYCKSTIIPEPGKFRIVTAGPAIQYTWLQPLQGSLLSNWANSSFSTMKEGWEEEVSSWETPEDWVWNSGDYKAATDQLNSYSSAAALYSVMEIYGLPEDFARKSGLLGAEIRMKTAVAEMEPYMESVSKKWSFTQTNGQLMGHPLSFPLLCVINLAGLSAALKEAVREGDLDRSAVQYILDHTKVNGDDILFPCPKHFCRRWERVTAELGLKLSVGKSYASTRFAMVNNVMFDMRNKRRIGYLNQKLVLNHCLKTGESTMTPFEIGHAFNKMFELLPKASGFLPDAIRRRKDTPVYGFQPNLFVPCELGGFGVDAKYAPGRVNFTREQRIVAKGFWTGSINSFLFREGKVETSICKDILKRMPRPLISTSTDARGWLTSGKLFPWQEGYDNYQSFVGSLSVPTSVKERDQRRLDLNKMKSIEPLSTATMRKSLVEKPFFLVPNLPKMGGGASFSYTRPPAPFPKGRKPKDHLRVIAEEEGQVRTLIRFGPRSFACYPDGVCREIPPEDEDRYSECSDLSCSCHSQQRNEDSCCGCHHKLWDECEDCGRSVCKYCRGEPCSKE
jgi:hypothetical protein